MGYQTGKCPCDHTATRVGQQHSSKNVTLRELVKLKCKTCGHELKWHSPYGCQKPEKGRLFNPNEHRFVYGSKNASFESPFRKIGKKRTGSLIP
jgi:hypothetical protein